MAPVFLFLQQYTKVDKKKTKGNVVPVPAVKAYRGRRGIAPLILNLGTECR